MSSTSPPHLVVCPHCAEDIKPAAKVCKHCGKDVAPKKAPRRKDHTTPLLAAILLIAVVCGGIVSLMPEGKKVPPSVWSYSTFEERPVMRQVAMSYRYKEDPVTMLVTCVAGKVTVVVDGGEHVRFDGRRTKILAPDTIVTVIANQTVMVKLLTDNGRETFMFDGEGGRVAFDKMRAVCE